MDTQKLIEALEAEVSRLKTELENARDREQDLEDTRKAMLFLLEDINESAAGIAKAKQEWEATFDSISDLLFIHDSEMRIVRCNRAYQSTAGLPFKEIVGKVYYEVFPRMEGPFKSCKNFVDSKGVHGEQEEEFFLPDTNRAFKLRVFSVNSEAREIFYIHTMEDITEEKRAAEKERILYEFTREIVASLDISYRLKTVCEAAVEFGYKMAWIGLLNDDTKDVVPMAQAGFDDGYLSSIKVRFDDSALGMGPTGRSVKNKTHEVQNSISSDEAFKPWKEEAMKRGYRSSASFPVMEEGKVIAVLSIYSVEEEFPKRDIEFLQTFANQTATYIKNARLFEEVKVSAEKIKEEMELSRHLLMIAAATAQTTDIDKLMEHVVLRLQNIMDCDICLSYLWDKSRHVFQPCRAVGLSNEMVPLFRVEYLDMKIEFIEKAFSGGIPQLVRADELHEIQKGLPEQGHQVPEVLRPADADSSMVVVPLTGKEGCLGLLICLYAESSKKFASGFTERDREVMAGISHQVSIALEEARLYKESIDRAMDLSRKIETIQAMHEIDVSILSIIDPGQILETAARMVGKLVFCDRATIGLVDMERGGLTYAAGFGVSLPKGHFVPFKDTSVTDVIRTGRAQYVANLKEVKDLLDLEKLLAKEGFLSHIRVPLIVRGEVIGALTVGAKRPAAFTSEDLSILEKLSSQISIALENSRLLSDLEELFMGVVKTLSEAIDAKSPWTRGHSDRVTAIALGIGREMGLTEKELRDLNLAGLLHDIGKLGTYESILNKPGKLTPDELVLMKQHPQKGAEILAPIKQMRNIVPAIKYHHESYDGKGYPEGLKGESIPLMARILTVADTADAMSADRPYRKGKSMDAIIDELKRCSGAQFDPNIVDAFIRSLGVKVA